MADLLSTFEFRYPYIPEPKQLEFHRCTSDEILFGGAGGPGKTEAVLARAVTMCLAIPNVKVLFLRRRAKELEQEVIPRLLMRIPTWIAKYNATKMVFVFRHNGARLSLGYLDKDDDMYQYIGAEYQLIVWDELTQHHEKPYKFLRTRLRMAGQVADDMTRMGWRPQMIATSNPTGRGHSWVKAMFVDPAPPNVQHYTSIADGGDGLSKTYIPATARDNRHLNLAEYEKQLMSLDPDMRRAIMDGDWSVFEGVRFGQFRYGLHVVKPEEVRLNLAAWPSGIGVDYGKSAPFAALWGAVLPGNRVLIYRELHKTGLTAFEQAHLVKNAEMAGERSPARPVPIALDPSMWAMQSESELSPTPAKDIPPPGSIARYYWDVFGGQIRKAQNARISGWALVDEYLRIWDDGTGLPGILIYDNCVNLIRTLPALQRSDKNPEDVDCFVGGTQISTPTGPRAVETLTVGDLVDTPMGPQRVIKAQPEHRVTVARVEFADGRYLVGTADHRIATQRGLVELQNLLPTDQAIADTDVADYGVWTPATRSFTAATPTAGSPAAATTSPLPGRSADTADLHSTGTSTPTTTAPSPMAGTSTTKTTTQRTTTLPTSGCCPHGTTPSTTTTTSRRNMQLGLQHRPAGKSYRATWPAPVPQSQRETERARIVEALSGRKAQPLNTAATSAAELSGTAGSVQSAVQSSVDRSGRNDLPRPVPMSVDGCYDVATVYALTVDGCGLYYANGLLVTNTEGDDHDADALRYLLQLLVPKMNRVAGNALTAVPSASGAALDKVRF